MIPHKDNALTTLRQIEQRLADPKPLEGQERFMVKGQLEYAISEVEALEELKKARPAPRPKKNDNGAASIAALSTGSPE